ncbi:Serine protease HTRA2, mitochondrial [Eumeta japonica]|uniref:Serine protease HTRA2, mitochondrial n=1 Tax=Eumeta variegata TaxID=151549 RepID=A0A4C1ZNY0_EUMVA|nr:Serine protease HTRA2, mitochondrial [Eumeta japonica]
MILGYTIVTAGVIGWVGLKERVSAATRSSDNLNGRREKYNFIADVVAISAPAVVYIEIKDGRRVDVFTGERLSVSNGSGFIVKEDGLILTNAHVVANKPHSTVHVKLMDGSTHTGFVEDVDMKSDLATLRIPVKGLPTMKLGSSADIRPGEWSVRRILNRFQPLDLVLVSGTARPTISDCLLQNQGVCSLSGDQSGAAQTRLTGQCHNCQSYGHSSRYCYHSALREMPG